MGTVNLKLDKELHKQIKTKCAENNITMQRQIARLIEEFLKLDDKNQADWFNSRR